MTQAQDFSLAENGIAVAAFLIEGLQSGDDIQVWNDLPVFTANGLQQPFPVGDFFSQADLRKMERNHGEMGINRDFPGGPGGKDFVSGGNAGVNYHITGNPGGAGFLYAGDGTGLDVYQTFPTSAQSAAGSIRLQAGLNLRFQYGGVFWHQKGPVRWQEGDSKLFHKHALLLSFIR